MNGRNPCFVTKCYKLSQNKKKSFDCFLSFNKTCLVMEEKNSKETINLYCVLFIMIIPILAMDNFPFNRTIKRYLFYQPTMLQAKRHINIE